MTKFLEKFISLEAAGGVLLLMVLIVALTIANSPLNIFYHDFLTLPIHIKFGDLEIYKPLFLWVNDGLMAVFFMLLGLELKREFLEGELSSPAQIVLPTLAAIGGIVVPAAIYIALNHARPEAIPGWAIPITTDVAFAVGLLALLGQRIPSSLKVFLVALSIVDDIMAIVIIAILYTSNLSVLSLTLASLGVLMLISMNLLGIKRIAAYMLVGVFIWICVLKSGIHATLAGVIIALCIPFKGTEQSDPSPLKTLEHNLHPWVAFFILPVFVFVNGGIPLDTLSFATLRDSIPLGITLGLFLGKTVGVFLFSWLTIQLGFARLPSQCNWRQMFGIAAFTGIGFTMSLFIAGLTFGSTPFVELARQGILVGSLLSGLLGILLLLKQNKTND